MTAEQLYLMHAQRVALQAAKEMAARPKLIVLPDAPPAPQPEACACAPSPTLH